MLQQCTQACERLHHFTLVRSRSLAHEGCITIYTQDKSELLLSRPQMTSALTQARDSTSQYSHIVCRDRYNCFIIPSTVSLRRGRSSTYQNFLPPEIHSSLNFYLYSSTKGRSVGCTIVQCLACEVSLSVNSNPGSNTVKSECANLVVAMDSPATKEVEPSARDLDF